MTALVKRNLRLYFGQKSGVFFSLLGALIAFGLYLVFLKHNMVASWAQLPDSQKLLDPWLIGGTLAITAVTTTNNGLNQMIVDRESGTLADLSLTRVSYVGIQASYLISTVVIGTIMQLVMFIGMSAYFIGVDQIQIEPSIILPVLGIMGLSSIVWTGFNLFILTFVTRVDSLGKIGTILGTSAGFFAGVYMPIGAVPNAAQTLMKWTPFPYNAALFRQLLMVDQIDQTFGQQTVQRSSLERLLGIGIDVQGLTTWQQNSLILVGFAGLFIAGSLLVAKRSRRTVLSKV